MQITKPIAVLAAAMTLLSSALSAHSQKPNKHTAPPVATHKTTRHKTASPAKAKPAKDTSAKVWVNTKTGVYHMPGQRWYGRTKEGEYMTEKEAQSHGYTHTQNGQ